MSFIGKVGRGVEKGFGITHCSRCDNTSQVDGKPPLCWNCNDKDRTAAKKETNQTALDTAKRQVNSIITSLQSAGIIPPTAFLYDQRIDALETEMIENPFSSQKDLFSKASSIAYDNK